MDQKHYDVVLDRLPEADSRPPANDPKLRRSVSGLSLIHIS